jgi:hypothetical protein
MTKQKSFIRKSKPTSKRVLLKHHFMGDDGSFYTIKNSKLIPVSKKTYLAYLKQEGLKFSDIKKLLKTSFPYQGNHYNLLKPPPRYVSIDYKLTNLVKTFWKHDIMTSNSDQGFISHGLDRPGYITIECRSNQGFSKLLILKKLFGPRKIIDVSKYYQEIKSFKGGKEKLDMDMKLGTKYPRQIRFTERRHLCTINFNHKLLEWMHQKLKLEIPKIEDSHLGSQIKSIYSLNKKYL